MTTKGTARTPAMRRAWKRWYKKKRKEDPDYYRRANRRQYAKHRKRMLKQNRAYRETLRGRYIATRRCARQRGIPFNLSFRDFGNLVEPFKCGYCGSHKRTTTGGNLDRKNSRFGYSKKNCIAACGPCQLAKSDWFSHREFCAFIPVLRRARRRKDIWQGFADAIPRRRRR
jgi:hypothetical protein